MGLLNCANNEIGGGISAYIFFVTVENHKGLLPLVTKITVSNASKQETCPKKELVRLKNTGE